MEADKIICSVIDKFGFAYFCVCYFLKRGFLDGKAGYVFARGKWRYFANIRRKINNIGETR